MKLMTLGEYEKTDWTPQQKSYAAQVTRLDRDVGQLLDLLKELKLDEKTIVFFSGDNGSSFADNSEIGKRFDQTMGGKLRGFKRSMYEGGLRQAAMVRWPGLVPAKRVTDEPWAFWDFLPTATELAGAKIPASFKSDGFSLVSISQRRRGTETRLFLLGTSRRQHRCKPFVSAIGKR